MVFQAVIFDLGGVLLRTQDWLGRERLADRLGVSVDNMYKLIFESPSAAQASVGKLTVQDHWEQVRQELHVSPTDLPGVIEEFFAGDKIDLALVDYLRSLRGRYKMGLLSNAWDNLRGLITDAWQIADVFDDIIISAEVGLAKPDPRIFHMALQRLGVTPGQAVFVDDFLQNIEAARQIGLAVVHFKDPSQARQELELILDGKA